MTIVGEKRLGATSFDIGILVANASSRLLALRSWSDTSSLRAFDQGIVIDSRTIDCALPPTYSVGAGSPALTAALATSWPPKATSGRLEEPHVFHDFDSHRKTARTPRLAGSEAFELGDYPVSVRTRAKSQYEDITVARSTARARTGTKEPTMPALVYLGPGKKALEQRPKPEIAVATDAIVRITRTTISAGDLRSIRGDAARCAPGRILGHEGIGVIDEVGSAVTAFNVGDKVLISSISACGSCVFCRKLMYSQCTTGGLILGNTIDGTQAGFVRIPYADTSLYSIPSDADEDAVVLLSDVLPTGFECGVLNGRIQPNSTVAIVGSGPIGLAALLTTQFYEPAQVIMIDLDDSRLEIAKSLGATAAVNSLHCKAADAIRKLTGGRGVDTAIEAVGIPDAFELCEKIVARGGTIATTGVHDAPVHLHLEHLWNSNVTITTRLVDTVSTPMLLNMLLSDKLDPAALVTHHFKFDRILDAYETIAHATDTGALKVIIEA